jgi:hypothetical protein
LPGFLSRLFGSQPPSHVDSVAQAPISTPNAIGADWADIEVAGESYHRDAIANVFMQLGRAAGGVTMQQAHLVPEPTNKYDRFAVKVMILGQHVGYVPADSSRRVATACNSIRRGSVAAVLARVWARVDDGTWRARVTLSFSGTTEREQDYAADEAAYQAQRAATAAAAAERAAKRAKQYAKRAAGEIDGQWWGNYKSSISELKRQKRFVEARDLLEKCVEASESAAVSIEDIPDPWPTEQMSVVLRKLGDTGELTWLERYEAACGGKPTPDSIAERLMRARLASNTPKS